MEAEVVVKFHRVITANCAVVLGLALIVGAPIARAQQTQAAPFLVLEARTTGGFVMPSFQFGQVPQLAVYSNGTVLTAAVVGAKYPGPIAQPIARHMVTPDMTPVLSGAERAHLLDPKFDWGIPSAADVPSTEIKIRQSAAAAANVIVIPSLGIDAGLTREQIAARKLVQSYLYRVSLAQKPYVSVHGSRQEWISGRWTYRAQAGSKVSLSVVRPWFGSALTSDGQCTLMTKSQNEKLVKMLPKLNSATRWSSGGKIWYVTLRPLLPHERNCSDIGY